MAAMMGEDEDLLEAEGTRRTQRGGADPRTHQMYQYHANLAPKGPKPDWTPHKWRGKSDAFHKHHVGHAGHPGFDEELTLRWGPKEREYREKIWRCLEQEEEQKRKELRSSKSDGLLRRKEAEKGRREQRHHFSDQPWRCGKWDGSPQTRTPANPARQFSWAQAWSPIHLFSYFAPIEASESAVRMFEALGPHAQPDPTKVHVCRPGSLHHHGHGNGQRHDGLARRDHNGGGESSASSPHHGEMISQDNISGESGQERPLLIAEDTIPRLGHRTIPRLARPQSAPQLRPGTTRFAARIPAPGTGPPRKVSHRDLLARRSQDSGFRRG